ILITGTAILLILLLVGLYYPLFDYRDFHVNGNAGIAVRTQAFDYERGKLYELPAYNADAQNAWSTDLLSYDLTDLDLSDRLNDLMNTDFDSKTKWPAKLPATFNPDEIMEMGKNPGLNLRKVHQKGVTGKGVNIAVIDQVLLTEHVEYKDRLKFYEEIHAVDEGGASMHGPAVSSIAVGKHVGVAPEANLYYIAETHGTFHPLSRLIGFDWDFRYLAKSIDRILEINKTLPKGQKIRAISISVGWGPGTKGFKEVDEAVKRAKKEGILVVSVALPSYYDAKLMGLGRDPLADADTLASYQPGQYWQKYFYENNKDYRSMGKTILVPMDSRCTASPTGTSNYAFYRSGGDSWIVPYVAGLYALCCQVQPDITPEQFFVDAIATGDIKVIEKNGKKYQLGTIVNPSRLIEKLQSKQE
ncbi:MAG: S8 family serine peptidase, partial [Methanobacterium sp.]